MSLSFPPHPDRRPALVLGASSGIGRATARMLADAGYPVAVGARRADRLDDLVAELETTGAEAVARAVDVTDTDSVSAFVADATERLGEPEVVVYCAGSLEMRRVWEMDAASVAASLDVNLGGLQRVLHDVLPGMISRRRGDVVAISSDVAYTARPRSGAYPAAKGGVDVLVRQARKELEGSGVRVGLVRPGPVKTEMGTEVDQETAEAVIHDWVAHGLARHPRMCKPSDLARGVTAMVTMPRGAQLTELEIQPEAPIEEDFS